MEAVLYEFIGMLGVDADVFQAVRKVDGFGEVVDLVSFFDLAVHGEHDLQAVVDDGAVEVLAFVRGAGVAVVDGVREAGVEIVFDADGGHAGSHDDGKCGCFESVCHDSLVYVSEGFFAVFQDAWCHVLCVVHAGLLDPCEVHTSGGEGDFILFGKSIAEACPEVLARGVCDDFRIDEGVPCTAFSVNGAFEAVIRVVHDADGSDGGAVGCERRECEDRFLQEVRSPFAGVGRAAAADGENHVGFLDFRDLCQSFGVFKCSVVAVEEGSGDVDLSADCFSDQRFSGDSGLGAADDDSGFSIFAANIRNLVIGIAADGEVRKIRTIHK